MAVIVPTGISHGSVSFYSENKLLSCSVALGIIYSLAYFFKAADVNKIPLKRWSFKNLGNALAMGAFITLIVFGGGFCITHAKTISLFLMAACLVGAVVLRILSRPVHFSFMGLKVW